MPLSDALTLPHPAGHLWCLRRLGSYPEAPLTAGYLAFWCGFSPGMSLYQALRGALCGISGRPNSMYMLCPYDIGRASWDRGGQQSVLFCNSPSRIGGRSPHRGERSVPTTPVIECYCFLINIIVEPPQPRPPHFYFAKVMFFTFSSVSHRRKHDPPGWLSCCCGFCRGARPDLTFAKKHFFMKCSFVETPGPIFTAWVPLGPPWVPLGLPWVPLGPPCFC